MFHLYHPFQIDGQLRVMARRSELSSNQDVGLRNGMLTGKLIQCWQDKLQSDVKAHTLPELYSNTYPEEPLSLFSSVWYYTYT